MSASFPSYRHHKPSGREYGRLIAEWLSNGRQLPDAVPLGELTVVELLAAYLESSRSGMYSCLTRPAVNAGD